MEWGGKKKKKKKRRAHARIFKAWNGYGLGPLLL